MGLALKVLYVGADFLSFAEFWKAVVFTLFWLAEMYYAQVLLRWLVSGVQELRLLERYNVRALATLLFCALFAAFGLFTCFRNTAGYGMAWELLQPKWSLAALAILEAVAAVYLFGPRRLVDAYLLAHGRRPDAFTRVAWLLLPVLLFTALALSLNATSDRRHGAEEPCARVDCWSGVWEMALVLAPVAAVAVHNARIYTLRGNILGILRPHTQGQARSPSETSSVTESKESVTNLADLTDYLRGEARAVNQQTQKKGNN